MEYERRWPGIIPQRPDSKSGLLGPKFADRRKQQDESATDRRKQRDLEYKRKLKARHEKIVAQDEYKKNRNLHAIEYGQSLPYSGHARDGGYGPKDYVSSTTQRARERSHKSTGYWQDSWGQRPAGTSVPNTSMTPRAGEDQTPALPPGYPTNKEGRSGPMRGHVDYTPRTAPPDYYGMMVPPTPAPRSKLPPSQHIDPQDLGNNGPQVIADVNNEISNTLNPQQDENSPWGTAARIAGGVGALGYGARALYNRPKHPAGWKAAVPHPNPNWRNVWGTFGTQASGKRGATWDAQRPLTGGSHQQPIRAIGNQIKRDVGSLRDMMQPRNVGASGGAPTGSPVKEPVWGYGSQPGSAVDPRSTGTEEFSKPPRDTSMLSDSRTKLQRDFWNLRNMGTHGGSPAHWESPAWSGGDAPVPEFTPEQIAQKQGHVEGVERQRVLREQKLPNSDFFDNWGGGSKAGEFTGRGPSEQRLADLERIINPDFDISAKGRAGTDRLFDAIGQKTSMQAFDSPPAQQRKGANAEIRRRMMGQPEGLDAQKWMDAEIRRMMDNPIDADVKGLHERYLNAQAGKESQQKGPATKNRSIRKFINANPGAVKAGGLLSLLGLAGSSKDDAWDWGDLGNRDAWSQLGLDGLLGELGNTGNAMIGGVENYNLDTVLGGLNSNLPREIARGTKDMASGILGDPIIAMAQGMGGRQMSDEEVAATRYATPGVAGGGGYGSTFAR